jgi:hypothetical protein|uniref:Uncharacterized protein n=1 Tax=Siphoviridae sp. ctzpQ31 TaxID=2823613 RepID=A0A8S5L891_9CAUD|nr:MAG TPA: hypothetical protein [Siphoviridae sp. ctzpQ31]DAY03668.1 MAG TPA: hypothetical protein [Bacteriophage sp.]
MYPSPLISSPILILSMLELYSLASNPEIIPCELSMTVIFSIPLAARGCPLFSSPQYLRIRLFSKSSKFDFVRLLFIAKTIFGRAEFL